MFICFGTTHERDGWTDGRTLHADISRAYAYSIQAQKDETCLVLTDSKTPT